MESYCTFSVPKQMLDKKKKQKERKKETKKERKEIGL